MKLYAVQIKNTIGSFAPYELLNKTLDEMEDILTTSIKKVEGETEESYNTRVSEFTTLQQDIKEARILIVEIAQAQSISKTEAREMLKEVNNDQY